MVKAFSDVLATADLKYFNRTSTCSQIRNIDVGFEEWDRNNIMILELLPK